MMVEFFGHEASTHTAIALLHLTTKIPICFGCCRRTGPFKFELSATGPFTFERTGNKEQDVRLILEALNHELEEQIRQDPSQYMWAHRRWKEPRKKPAPESAQSPS